MLEIKRKQAILYRLYLCPFVEKYCCYLSSGGSTYKSFRRAPPPTGPNSFVFTYVFTEKHLCQRLAPPQMRVGAPQQEILDPPLFKI